MRIANGLFITFEGVECAGKSTQLPMLASFLKDKGYDVLITREPGGSSLGESLRGIIKQVEKEEKITKEAELLLFAASRVQLMKTVVVPHLEQGGVVLCDRFVDSTTAYQGYGRGINLSWISMLHHFTVCNYWPNITFLLDLDIPTSFQRRKERFLPIDRIENEPISFHQQVRDGFLTIARQHPRRIHLLDAQNDQEKIHRKIIDIFYHVTGRLTSSDS